MEEEELKKEIAIFPSKTLHQYDSGKLLWKGTIKEAIEKGKVTQEEVDKWNMEDEIGEDYMEGFQAGQLAEQQRIIELIKDLNLTFLKDNSVWKLTGDELNDLWEEKLLSKIQNNNEKT